MNALPALSLLCLCVASAAQSVVQNATISSGGIVRPDGTVIVIGQPVAGGACSTSGSLQVCLDAGFVPAVWTPSCPADMNGDGNVNTADLTFFLGRFGQPATPGSLAERADFNRDGEVNTVDLVFFLGRFGRPCPT